MGRFCGKEPREGGLWQIATVKLEVPSLVSILEKLSHTQIQPFRNKCLLKGLHFFQQQITSGNIKLFVSFPFPKAFNDSHLSRAPQPDSGDTLSSCPSMTVNNLIEDYLIVEGSSV